MFKDSFARYKGLFVSTTLFVVFFMLYLAVNYVFQRAAVYDVRYAMAVSHMLDKSQGQDAFASSLKDDLLKVNKGGDYSISPEDQISLKPLNEFLAPDVYSMDGLLSSWLDKDNIKLSASLKELRKKVNNKKRKKLKLVSLLQIIAAILTVLLYLMVIWQLFKQLSVSDDVAVESKKENEGIMNTISDGLFLLDREMEIGVEQSKSLKEMFDRERDLEGNFLEFISGYVTPENVQIAKDYLDLLFGDRVKERLVEDLNPLKRVEINIQQRDGSLESRYLDFKFKRVMNEEGDLNHLLASTTDVTTQVLLEKELEDVKEEQEAQLNLLMSILHIDNAQLVNFFNGTEKVLNDVNETLEGYGHSEVDIRDKLNKIKGPIHRIKGDAAALGLHQFEFSAHEFEEDIARIQSEKKQITGKDFLPLAVRLREMFADLEKMRSLIGRFAEINAVTNNNEEKTDSVSGPVVANIAVDKLSPFHQLASTVAERNSKRVMLTCYGFDSLEVPEPLVEPINSIAVQLIRNSIVHGAEMPSQRTEKGKTDFVNVVVSLSEDENKQGYYLIVRDDGAGIDEAAIAQRAVDLGLMSPDQAALVQKQQVLALLFHPGFSSQQEASQDAGRGVGLDLVRSISKEHNGRVGVIYQKGKYCQFRIFFPSPEGEHSKALVNKTVAA